jgi:hypothetical protein
MTQSFLCYRLLTVARHPGHSGHEDSHTRCTSHVAATASNRILATFGSRLLASVHAVISRSAWRPPSPTDGSGLLATTTTAVGISTRRACTATLWLTSVEVTAASTYDFHTTHSKKLLHNPKMSILHS